jgi:hypothetical protein
VRWHGLCDLMPRCRRAVERSSPALPLRERAAVVTAEVFPGMTTIDDLPGAISVAALAILSNCAPETWLVRPSASEVVHATDLHAIPDQAPRLLRRPGIAETRHPQTGERLWGRYATVGWYPLEGAIYLVGLSYPDGYAVARWTPDWTGQDLEPQLPGLDLASPLIDARGEHHEYAVQAARYLLVLALLVDVADGPLRVELDRKTRWRHVYPDDRARRPVQSPAPSPPAPIGPPTTSADPGGGTRVVEARPVTGHLKRQRYGAGHALTKWIYVRGYQARRWCAPRWSVTAADAGPGITR